MNEPLTIGRMRGCLLRWFGSNARDFPWRRTKSPWRLLLAEMMLRRTRADQVVPVYKEFVSRYNTPKKLVEASAGEVGKALNPLGLQWRVRNFLEMGRVLQEDFRGRVPRSRTELKKLPGVGDYVAGAVLSVGFGAREWIVDSNIVRVFRRYYGIRTSREGRRDRNVIELAKQYCNCRNPRDANLAILDFAAAVCRPYRPECVHCQLRRRCLYLNKESGIG